MPGQSSDASSSTDPEDILALTIKELSASGVEAKKRRKNLVSLTKAPKNSILVFQPHQRKIYDVLKKIGNSVHIRPSSRHYAPIGNFWKGKKVFFKC